MDSIPQFLIAAPTSGSGKTTVSRGLMALFVKKGLKVQPFKCGPDYIDTKYHEAVCGRPSINLDTFMASPEHVRSLYARYSADADVAVVEGMMGMYDGYDRDRGSSAEVARLLGIPVVLVVDAKSAAYSMAPLLSGFINFRPDIRIAGVIFNRVGSPHHYRMLQEVCEDLNVTCLGYLPKRKELEQESRHLGLDFSRSKETEGLDNRASIACGGCGGEVGTIRAGEAAYLGSAQRRVLFLPLCGASGYSALYGHGHFLQSGAGPGYSARDGFALSARRLSREPSGGTCRGKACQGVYPQLYRGWWQDAGRMRGDDISFAVRSF